MGGTGDKIGRVCFVAAPGFLCSVHLWFKTPLDILSENSAWYRRSTCTSGAHYNCLIPSITGQNCTQVECELRSLFSHTRVLYAFCCTLRYKPQDSPRFVPFFMLWLTLRNLLFRDLELTKAQLMSLKHRFFLLRWPKVLLHNWTNLKILRPSSLRYLIFLLS